MFGGGNVFLNLAVDVLKNSWSKTVNRWQYRQNTHHIHRMSINFAWLLNTKWKLMTNKDVCKIIKGLKNVIKVQNLSVLMKTCTYIEQGDNNGGSWKCYPLLKCKSQMDMLMVSKTFWWWWSTECAMLKIIHIKLRSKIFSFEHYGVCLWNNVQYNVWWILYVITSHRSHKDTKWQLISIVHCICKYHI